MKLLLTSAGIKNKSIAKALISLLEKPVGKIKVGFIPTAANVEEGEKEWFTSQVTQLTPYGFTWIDVVDISAPGVDWKVRLTEVDVVLMSGGNTFHLLDQVLKTKFDDWLKENIESKVYVGVSASSILMTPSIAIAGVDNGDVNLPAIIDLTGLGFVDFEISPHTPEMVSHKANKKYTETCKSGLYGLDDQSAIQVIDGKVTVISEGERIKY